MQRDRVRAVALLVLGAVAVAAVAAAVGGPSAGGGSGPAETGAGPDQQTGESPTTPLSLPMAPFQWFLRVVLGGGVLLLVGILLVDAYRDGLAGVLDRLRTYGRWTLGAAGAAAVWGVIYLIFRYSGRRGQTPTRPNASNASAGGGPGTGPVTADPDAVQTVTDTVPPSVAVVLVPVVAAAVAALFASRYQPTRGSRSGEPPEPSATGSGGATTAAPAVDVTAVPATNDVYAAWLDLVDRVGARDRTDVTPRDLARRARGAGLDPSAVDELTQLFREVRYGGRAPTPERERRARDARDRLGDGDEGTTSDRGGDARGGRDE